jgi:orotate phosphoribosyltransferase
LLLVCPFHLAQGDAMVSPVLHLEPTILEYIRQEGMLRIGHFAYPSGRHSAIHLDHDRLLTNPEASSRMGYALAKKFFTSKVETVASPSIWGAGLAQWVAYFLEPRAKVVYATPEPDGRRLIAPAVQSLVSGRRVLLIDNVTLSGETMRQFRQTIETAGGEVIGIGCLWAASAPEEANGLSGLLNSLYPSWEPGDCPLCLAGDRDVEHVAP